MIWVIHDSGVVSVSGCVFLHISGWMGFATFIYI